AGVHPLPGGAPPRAAALGRIRTGVPATGATRRLNRSSTGRLARRARISGGLRAPGFWQRASGAGHRAPGDRGHGTRPLAPGLWHRATEVTAPSLWHRATEVTATETPSRPSSTPESAQADLVSLLP